MGLVFPNEPTLVTAVSMNLLAKAKVQAPGSTCFDAFNYSHMEDAYDILSQIKNIVHNIRSRGKLPHHGAVVAFPSTVQEFRQQYPEMYARAYGEGDPQVSELAIGFETMVTLLRARLPARSSHQAISVHIPKRQGTRSLHNPMFMAHMGLARQQLQGSEIDLPGFTMLKSRSGIPLQSSTDQPLALT